MLPWHVASGLSVSVCVCVCGGVFVDWGVCQGLWLAGSVGHYASIYG